MRILVTGGAGDIGSHMVHLLVEHGDEVSVCSAAYGLRAVSLRYYRGHRQRRLGV